ncbi:MAG: CFI-box-CTERM domain-containing protein [Thermotaleaceae bacterium]
MVVKLSDPHASPIAYKSSKEKSIYLYEPQDKPLQMVLQPQNPKAFESFRLKLYQDQLETVHQAVYGKLDVLKEISDGAPVWEPYPNPISVTEKTTIKAIAVYDGMISEVAAFEYDISDQCFIATAAFGTKFQPAVVLLRKFRDQYLQTNSLGQAFVKFYYRHSPRIAAYIARNQALKAMVRLVLIPFIGIAYMIMYHPWLLAMTLTLSLMIMLQKRKILKEKL